MRSPQFSPSADDRTTAGQAFLALVFLVGAIIILVGITLVILINSSVDTSYGYQAAMQAEAAATAGIEDGLLRLNRSISTSTGASGYTLYVGSNTATVVITQNSPSTGKVTVLASSTVSGRRRKVSVVVTQDATTTGDINVISWQDIP